MRSISQTTLLAFILVSSTLSSVVAHAQGAVPRIRVPAPRPIERVRIEGVDSVVGATIATLSPHHVYQVSVQDALRVATAIVGGEPPGARILYPSRALLPDNVSYAMREQFSAHSVSIAPGSFHDAVKSLWVFVQSPQARQTDPQLSAFLQRRIERSVPAFGDALALHGRVQSASGLRHSAHLAYRPPTDIQGVLRDLVAIFEKIDEALEALCGGQKRCWPSDSFDLYESPFVPEEIAILRRETFITAQSLWQARERLASILRDVTTWLQDPNPFAAPEAEGWTPYQRFAWLMMRSGSSITDKSLQLFGPYLAKVGLDLSSLDNGTRARLRQEVRFWVLLRKSVNPLLTSNLRKLPTLQQGGRGWNHYLGIQPEEVVSRIAVGDTLSTAIQSRLYALLPEAYWRSDSDLPDEDQWRAGVVKVRAAVWTLDASIRSASAVSNANAALLDGDFNRGRHIDENDAFIVYEHQGRVSIRHRFANPAHSLRTSVAKLPGRGDNINIESDRGRLIVVDTAYGNSALNAVIKRAEQMNANGEQLRVRLVITHRDADHVSGLVPLLQAPNVTIEEVIVGHGASEGSKTWRRARALLLDTFDETTTSGVSHYLRKPPPPLVPMFRSTVRGNGRVTTRDLQTGEDLQIQLLQLRSPGAVENAASLVTKMTYRGISQLLMGDADVSVLEALMVDTAKLQSTVLKWPHHVWYPRTRRDEELVRQFLRAVNPRLVLVSNIGAPNHRNNIEKLKALIRSELGEDVLVLWTEQGGDLDLFTHAHGGNPIEPLPV